GSLGQSDSATAISRPFLAAGRAGTHRDGPAGHRTGFDPGAGLSLLRRDHSRLRPVEPVAVALSGRNRGTVLVAGTGGGAYLGGPAARRAPGGAADLRRAAGDAGVGDQRRRRLVAGADAHGAGPLVDLRRVISHLHSGVAARGAPWPHIPVGTADKARRRPRSASGCPTLRVGRTGAVPRCGRARRVAGESRSASWQSPDCDRRSKASSSGAILLSPPARARLRFSSSPSANPCPGL